MARVFSGIQPSGELHIGNYLGAVQNWVGLQGEHECFFCIVDYHAITQDYEVASLEHRTLEMAVSLLAVGIDPERSVLFVQSHVPEHTELAWIFMTVTPLGELERMTQFKDKSGRQESVPAGLLNYPVLQAADVLLYKANMVPVGEDQVQHVELMREIARKWNARYGPGVFPEPEARVGKARRILGLDGDTKMSKSLGNTIGILEEPDRIWALLRPAKTDPARVTRHDPGDPEKCNLYTLHQYFSPPPVVQDVAHKCRAAGWGCLDCKRVLADNISATFGPFRERARELRARPDRVRELLRAGVERARAVAVETMREVRERMGLLPADLPTGVRD
ncbi:MAG: tryptophan--tRNA ligase [Gemmatimonadetes bacterium]|nr:tryptophan--tRNA ligase [Gemmatimonadota bacterium]